MTKAYRPENWPLEQNTAEKQEYLIFTLRFKSHGIH